MSPSVKSSKELAANFKQQMIETLQRILEDARYRRGLGR